MLIREILTHKPWEYRSKSAERVHIWDGISKILNLLDGFIVNQRSIRDRYKSSLQKRKFAKHSSFSYSP